MYDRQPKKFHEEGLVHGGVPYLTEGNVGVIIRCEVAADDLDAI